MNQSEALDETLRSVFSTAQVDPAVPFVILGPLLSMEFLFPTAYSKTLLTIGSLHARPRRETAASASRGPSLQVTLGIGSHYEKKLFPFFNSLLQFQTKVKFGAFLRHGYSLHITGGHFNETVARTFIATPVGLLMPCVNHIIPKIASLTRDILGQ
jgi:hypothetical protein